MQNQNKIANDIGIVSQFASKQGPDKSTRYTLLYGKNLVFCLFNRNK